MTNTDEIVKALRVCAGQEDCESCSFDCGGFDTTCIDNLETAAADAIETLQAHRNQARLDCAVAERNHMNTLERLLEAQERITELTAERDALLKSFTVTSQPIKVIQPKGVVE